MSYKTITTKEQNNNEHKKFFGLQKPVMVAQDLDRKKRQAETETTEWNNFVRRKLEITLNNCSEWSFLTEDF